MRLIFAFILLAGLGLAAFAIHTAQTRFGEYQAALASTREAIVPVTEVVVVSRQVRYGDALRPSDVRLVPWPAEAVPTGAFQTMEDVFPAGETGLRTALRVMERHEPLLRVKVTAPGEDAGVAAQLGAGMRAFALRVDVMSGVSGFLRPGDRVDVYWTGEGRTKLIHPNLPLIAIDQQTDEERSNPTIAQTVTVEAPPDVIAKLAQAQATGRLTLALVGVRDEGESEEVQATLDQILGAEEVSEQPRTCTIRNRRGSEVVLIPIPCPEEG